MTDVLTVFVDVHRDPAARNPIYSNERSHPGTKCIAGRAVTPGPPRTVWDRRVSSRPAQPREWHARPRVGLGLPRMLPASGVHISTNGHRASGLETRVRALVWKDRYRATWKNRETRQSSRCRPCGCQCPLAQCCSSHPDKTLSWVWLSRLQAARRARSGVRAADRRRYCCRLSASLGPLASAPASNSIVMLCRRAAIFLVERSSP